MPSTSHIIYSDAQSINSILHISSPAINIISHTLLPPPNSPYLYAMIQVLTITPRPPEMLRKLVISLLETDVLFEAIHASINASLTVHQPRNHGRSQIIPHGGNHANNDDNQDLVLLNDEIMSYRQCLHLRRVSPLASASSPLSPSTSSSSSPSYLPHEQLVLTLFNRESSSSSSSSSSPSPSPSSSSTDRHRALSVGKDLVLLYEAMLRPTLEHHRNNLEYRRNGYYPQPPLHGNLHSNAPDDKNNTAEVAQGSSATTTTTTLLHRPLFDVQELLAPPFDGLEGGPMIHPKYETPYLHQRCTVHLSHTTLLCTHHTMSLCTPMCTLSNHTLKLHSQTTLSNTHTSFVNLL